MSGHTSPQIESHPALMKLGWYSLRREDWTLLKGNTMLFNQVCTKCPTLLVVQVMSVLE